MLQGRAGKKHNNPYPPHLLQLVLSQPPTLHLMVCTRTQDCQHRRLQLAECAPALIRAPPNLTGTKTQILILTADLEMVFGRVGYEFAVISIRVVCSEWWMDRGV